MRLFRPRSGLQIQGIMAGADTNRDTNPTTWLSHADKSIAGEIGRRAVSQAETGVEDEQSKVTDSSTPCALGPASCGGGTWPGSQLLITRLTPATVTQRIALVTKNRGRHKALIQLNALIGNPPSLTFDLALSIERAATRRRFLRDLAPPEARLCCLVQRAIGVCFTRGNRRQMNGACRASSAISDP